MVHGETTNSKNVGKSRPSQFQPFEIPMNVWPTPIKSLTKRVDTKRTCREHSSWVRYTTPTILRFCTSQTLNCSISEHIYAFIGSSRRTKWLHNPVLIKFPFPWSKLTISRMIPLTVFHDIFQKTFKSWKATTSKNVFFSIIRESNCLRMTYG